MKREIKPGHVSASRIQSAIARAKKDWPNHIAKIRVKKQELEYLHGLSALAFGKCFGVDPRARHCHDELAKALYRFRFLGPTDGGGTVPLHLDDLRIIHDAMNYDWRRS